MKVRHFSIPYESICGLHKKQHKKYDEYDNMLFNKFKLQNKQSDQAYQYCKIIANGVESCTQDTGDFKFPGKISVDQVSKKTYTQ